MSKIIGVTVGTPLSVEKIKEKIKPITSEELKAALEAALLEAKNSGEFDGEDGTPGAPGADGYTPVKGKDYFDGQPGADGYSPSVSVNVIAGGHRITITDAKGTKTFDVMNGKDGTGGGGGSGSGEDGATFYPYVDADGNLSWTNDGGLQNPDPVNIKGADGADGYTPVKGKDYFDGEPGADGYTPVKGKDYFDGEPGKDGTSVTVSSVSESSADGGTNVVTFSDGKKLNIKNGSKGSDGAPGAKGDPGYTPQKGIDYFDGAKGEDGYTPQKGVDYFDGLPGEPGKDGQDGAPGAKGDPGYTPQKGTDYWTASDKAEMVADVLAALPSAEGVMF